MEEIPAGTVSGTACFQPRPASLGSHLEEYLYIESGSMIMPDGTELQVHRRWIWKLNSFTRIESQDEGKSKISVYFVKTDGETIDYLYQDLNFQPYSEVESKNLRLQGYFASATHPCREDSYKSGYLFWMINEGTEKGSIASFTISHEVRGPKKDYISKTTYKPKRRAVTAS
jgi:hypothetical protein